MTKHDKNKWCGYLTIQFNVMDFEWVPYAKLHGIKYIGWLWFHVNWSVFKT